MILQIGHTDKKKKKKNMYQKALGVLFELTIVQSTHSIKAYCINILQSVFLI